MTPTTTATLVLDTLSTIGVQAFAVLSVVISFAAGYFLFKWGWGQAQGALDPTWRMKLRRQNLEFMGQEHNSYISSIGTKVQSGSHWRD